MSIKILNVQSTLFSDIGVELVIDDATGKYTSGVIIGEQLTKLDEDDVDCLEYSAAMDAIERFILALACEGIDITTPEFGSAVDTVAETMANHYD